MNTGHHAPDVDCLVVISDLHIGSTLALCPDMTELADGSHYLPNPVQAWIWEQWIAFRCHLKERLHGRRWGLVINGDLIDGVHHKTKEVIHPDVGIQVKTAIEVLEPVAKDAAYTYVVRGTESHVGTSETAIGRAIGAMTAGKEHSAHHWLIDVNGCLVSAKHHIGSTARTWTRATALGASLANERLEALNARRDIPNVLLRAHRHVPGLYKDPSGMLIVTPAWQALTSYGWKVVPDAVPWVGGVILDWKGVRQGGLPLVDDTQQWPLPTGGGF